VKFPKRLRYKNQGKALVTIYQGKNVNQPYYLYWRVLVDGKRRSRFKNFSTYSAAKKAGEKLVNEIATGRLAAALSPGQVTDALTAFELLRSLRISTGRDELTTLRGAVGELAGALSKLPSGVALTDAVTGFVRNVASVHRKDLSEAVKDFVAGEKPRTLAPAGERPQLAPGWASQKAKILDRFAAMFPGHAVNDLTKGHLDQFFAAIPKFKRFPAASPKTRNHYRTSLKQFLNWAARRDYLSLTHRLMEADSLKPEKTNGAPTEIYTPKNLRDLLTVAQDEMRALIAIGGLAGLRTAELLRLDWSEVWRVKGHIEVTAMKSKTRQRRLVVICPPSPLGCVRSASSKAVRYGSWATARSARTSFTRRWTVCANWPRSRGNQMRYGIRSARITSPVTRTRT
jgi:hypothetical protein